MNNQSRVHSILNAVSLDFGITGFPAFHLTDLELDSEIDINLPSNLRLGHLAEKVVAELIKASKNFNVLNENVQIQENNKTIGELDFIIEDSNSHEITHLEVAYKFYLYDPSVSNDPIKNWIGPNRNDSLVEKLDKLKTKQFPLLQHTEVKASLVGIETEKMKQALCFMHHLFIPYQFKGSIDKVFKPAIQGYYLGMIQFQTLDHSNRSYYIPAKTDWGLDPAENKNWLTKNEVEGHIEKCMEEKQAPLCWRREGEKYDCFFVVWW